MNTINLKPITLRGDGCNERSRALLEVPILDPFRAPLYRHEWASDAAINHRVCFYVMQRLQLKLQAFLILSTRDATSPKSSELKHVGVLTQRVVEVRIHRLAASQPHTSWLVLFFRPW